MWWYDNGINWINNEAEWICEINLLVENNAKKIKVTQINNNGEIVDTYESINEAEKITHLPRGNIARAVREGIKCGGYYWRRVDE